MTQEEKDYCERCGTHESCGYASRGLQDECEKIQTFADGMEAGIAKASLWLGTEWEDLGIHWVRGAQSAEIVEQFEKAMSYDGSEEKPHEFISGSSQNYFPIEFSSYEDYVKYLKEKGFAIEVTENNSDKEIEL